MADEQLGYVDMAAALRSEILAGRWDAPDQPFPAAQLIADRFGVSRPTASRAFQLLAAEGLLQMRTKAAPVVVPADFRPERAAQPSGRYARARHDSALVWAADTDSEIEKATVDTAWVIPPPMIRHYLKAAPDEDVLRRRSRTLVDGVPVESTAMHFPRWLVAEVPDLEQAASIRVVALIESTGRRIIALTDNHYDTRLATDDEIGELDLRPGALVTEWTHGTYAVTEDDPDGPLIPVEAVVNVTRKRPITFQTDELPIGHPRRGSVL